MLGDPIPLRPNTSTREQLEAALRQLGEEAEADFAAWVLAGQTICARTAGLENVRPGVRNVARVIGVCLDREGKALASIRGTP